MKVKKKKNKLNLDITLLKTLNLTTTTLLLALATFSLTSCKKNDTKKPVVFPVTLYTQKLEVATGIRMFTKDGEIKDQQQIAKFSKDILYFSLELEQGEIGAKAITFISNEKAHFEYNDVLKYEVAISDKQFLFTSEMKYYSTSYNPNEFTNHILKYRNVKAAGPFWGSEFREVRVAYGDYKQLQFPILAYHTVSRDVNKHFTLGGTTFNEFNEGILSYMKTGDTIAVKNYRLFCVSK